MVEYDTVNVEVGGSSPLLAAISVSGNDEYAGIS